MVARFARTPEETGRDLDETFALAEEIAKHSPPLVPMDLLFTVYEHALARLAPGYCAPKRRVDFGANRWRAAVDNAIRFAIDVTRGYSTEPCPLPPSAEMPEEGWRTVVQLYDAWGRDVERPAREGAHPPSTRLGALHAVLSRRPALPMRTPFLAMVRSVCGKPPRKVPFDAIKRQLRAEGWDVHTEGGLIEAFLSEASLHPGLCLDSQGRLAVDVSCAVDAVSDRVRRPNEVPASLDVEHDEGASLGECLGFRDEVQALTERQRERFEVEVHEALRHERDAVRAAYAVWSLDMTRVSASAQYRVTPKEIRYAGQKHLPAILVRAMRVAVGQ